MTDTSSNKVSKRLLSPRPLVTGLMCMLILGCSGGREAEPTNNNNYTGGGASSSSSSSSDSSSNSSSSSSSVAQGCEENCIIINEAMSSNSIFKDEDGDSPDWFEIHNYGTQAVSLLDWSITDDDSIPQKWAFPEYNLRAGGYLRVWASDKGRSGLGVFRTLVNQGDEFSYLIPTSAVDANWPTLGFDDGTWLRANSGFGYGDDDDATVVELGTLAVFARRVFQLSSAAEVSELWLDIDYDDAFVAYLNGVEIARSNMLGEQPAFDAVPTAQREASMYQSGNPVRFDVTENRDLLQDGDNVLSIQVHNQSSGSSDLTLIPFLSAFYNTSTTDGVEPPTLLALEDRGFHTNFKISSSGETLYLYNANGSQTASLVVEGLTSEYSIGRSVNTGDVVYYKTPTPGYRNTPTEYTGIVSSEVVFSHQGGVNSPASVSLSGAASGEIIRYTLNASEPTAASPQYSGALAISDNTVIRASVFSSGYIASRANSRTYLSNVSHDLPVVALVTDADNLFNEDTGIYMYGDSYEPVEPYYGANFWQDWERDIHFSFYTADGSLGTALNGGVKIFGGWSRALDQRSLSIFARNRYGTKEIDYPLFPGLPYDTFESVVLRNSGNDWLNTMMRDAALTSLMQGSGLDIQAFRPVVSYINGEYWGLYNLREKVNEDFLASRHGIDPDEVDILERQGEIVEGDNTDYNALMVFVENNSLDETANYNVVAEQIDIDNFILYQVAQIYFNNQDWPGNNIKFWRAPGGKWRWILYDTDFGFGIWNPEDYYQDTLAFALSESGPEWPNPPWSTLLLRRLIENETFRNKLINCFADELNTRFLPAAVSSHIDTITADIAAEIPAHFNRWEGTAGEFWSTNVANMKGYGNSRPAQQRSHIENRFGLTGQYSLTVTNSNPQQGSVLLNTIALSDSRWSGLYFNEVPITLTAQASDGYVFSHWQGDSDATTAKITLSPSSATSLQAVFTAAP